MLLQEKWPCTRLQDEKLIEFFLWGTWLIYWAHNHLIFSESQRSISSCPQMQRLQDLYPLLVHQYLRDHQIKNAIWYILQTGSEGFKQKPDTVTLLSLKSKGEDRGEVGTRNEREWQRASWCSLLNASIDISYFVDPGCFDGCKAVIVIFYLDMYWPLHPLTERSRIPVPWRKMPLCKPWHLSFALKQPAPSCHCWF